MLSTQSRSPALLDHAVLGLVLERSSYGYEICERLERRFAGVVDASQSGVYKVLQRLHGDGLIERARPVTVVSEGRPRIHYRATKRGASEYRDWIARVMRDDGARSEVLSRLASVGLLDVTAMLEVVVRYERETLAEIQAVASGGDGRQDPTAALLEDLIVEERRQSLQAQLQWAAYARDRLDAYANGAAL